MPYLKNDDQRVVLTSPKPGTQSIPWAQRFATTVIVLALTAAVVTVISALAVKAVQVIL